MTAPPLTVADVLDRAADVIDQRGWTQGAYVSNDGALCAAAAIDAVTEPIGASWNPARGVLRTSLGQAISLWNDAPERTQAEVVAKLREVAAANR